MKNSEKYKTYKERGEAFQDFCRGKVVCERCPLYTQARKQGSTWCSYVWLELEAEEEKEDDAKQG